MLQDEGTECVLAIFIPPLVTRAEDVAQAIAASAQASSKTVLATFFGAAGVPEALAPVPCYVFPESAAAALARVVEYARWRSRPDGCVPVFSDIDTTTAEAIVGRALAGGGGWLDPVSAFALIESCGITTAGIRIVVSAQGALAAARQAGYPVVLKGAGPALLHKTEARAVFTDLASEEAVMRAFHALSRRPDVTQILVQRHVGDGVEMFAGAMADPQFGHLVMAGSGGTMLELLRDTACRLAPLTDTGAAEMLNEIRGITRLRGYRGATPLDEAAYRTTLLRVSALLRACPQIQELDLNPVIVTTHGAVAVDARIRVAAAD